MKKCRKCGGMKPLEDYYKDKRSEDGRVSACKECRRKATREYVANNYDKCRKATRDWMENNQERMEKVAKRYRKANSGKISDRSQKHYRKNRDRLKEYSRNYVKDHKEQAKEAVQKWNRANKKRYQERIKNDPQFKVRVRSRGIYGEWIKLKKEPKNKKNEKIIGCTWIEMQEHLKSCEYDPEINQIDHVIPLFWFDLVQDNHLKVAWNFRNIQALTPLENNQKKNNLLEGWEDTLRNISTVINIDPQPIIEYIKEKRRNI